MPPKRQIKSNLTKPKPLVPVQSNDGEDSCQPTEAELRFDQEVLWCVTQFEKLINSGKISDAKKAESLKVINTLRRQNASKIQKISLMKQYFKDYKTKMLKDEELVKQNSIVNVQVTDEGSSSKGVFVKKKTETKVHNDEMSNSTFRFNFEIDEDLSSQVQSINIQN